MEQKMTTPEPIEKTSPSSMTEKMELLEDRVRETMEGTRLTAEHIVDNVKATVGETINTIKDTVTEAESTATHLVETVKDTKDNIVTKVQRSFDLPSYVAQRPWATFGGAVLVGYFVGAWTYPGARRQRYFSEQGSQYYADDDNLYAAAMSGGATLEDLDTYKDPQKYGYAYPPHVSSTTQKHPGNIAQEQVGRQRQRRGGQFQEEWNILRDVALGTLIGTLRAMVREQVPTFAPHIEKILNRTSAKLGTEPIEPLPVQEHSQAKETRSAGAHSSAKIQSLPGSQEPTSAIQGIPTEPQLGAVQPYPSSQYRR